MRYLSVCSGIEAASVAFEPLGWTPLAFSEIEAFPRAVLKHRWPGVPLHGDFTELRHQPWIVDADLLVGGTPCVAFSVAGLRKSLDDERGNLTLEFIRLANAIDDLRRAAGREPAYILWENVPGVFSTHDNVFGAFLGGLVGCDDALPAPHGLGWRDAGVVAGPRRVAAWRVLDARHFGLAQRRRRVFVLALGGAGAWRCADALLPISDSGEGHPSPSRETRQVVAPTLGSGPPFSRTGNERSEADAYVAVAPTLSARARGGGGLGTDFDCDGGLIQEVVSTLDASYGRLQGASGQDMNHGHSHLIAHTLRADGFDASEDGTGRGTPLVPVLPATDAFRGGAGPIAFQGGSQQDQILTPDQISPTLAHSSNTHGGHYQPKVLLPLPFDTTQITSPGNYSNPKPGDPMHPLAAGTHVPAVCIHADAIGRDGTNAVPGPDAEGRVRLRDAGLGVIADGSAYSLTTGQPHAVAFPHEPEVVKPVTLDSANGQAIAFQERGRADGRSLDVGGELAYALTAPAGGGRAQERNILTPTMAVRRITPIEAEKLMGLEPGYTNVPYRGKPACDGNRYRALGNSFAVPVIRYIGSRIQAVEEACRTLTADDAA